MFTKLGHAVAVLTAFFGASAVVAGYEIDINQAQSVVAEMFNLSSAEWNGTQGKILRKQGFIMLFCGLVLGVLCDISRSVSARVEG